MSDDENEGDQNAYSIVFEGEAAGKAFISKNGIAAATFPNGDKYEGNYQDGKRNGEGKYTWSAPEGAVGGKYTGGYKDGMRNGRGLQNYPDKAYYTGEWEANKRHGRGTYVYPNGDRYCGAWENDKKKGSGTYLYASSQTQLSGVYDGDSCADGTWEYYDGANFACKYQGGQVVEYGGKQLHVKV